MTFLGNEVAGRDSKTMPRRWTRIAQRERLLFTRPQSSIMVFLIVRIEGIEGTAKPLIGLLTLLGLPRLVLHTYIYNIHLDVMAALPRSLSVKDR